MTNIPQKSRQLEMTALYLAVRAIMQLPFNDELYDYVKTLQREIQAAREDDEKLREMNISLN